MVPFLVSSHIVTTLCRNFYLEGMFSSVRVSTMQCLLWKWGWSWLVSVWHSIWVAVYTKVTLWVLKPNHFFTGGLARKESLFSFWYILGTLPGTGFHCGHSIIVSLLFPAMDFSLQKVSYRSLEKVFQHWTPHLVGKRRVVRSLTTRWL